MECHSCYLAQNAKNGVSFLLFSPKHQEWNLILVITVPKHKNKPPDRGGLFFSYDNLILLMIYPSYA